MSSTSETSAKIDPEFEAKIPPLRPEELKGLEASIKADGCRDALVVWDKDGTLLDGHNRYRICRKHKLAFFVHPIFLPSRDAAETWILENQRNRRNLNKSQLAMLAADLERLYAKQAKERQQATQLAGRDKDGKTARGSVKAEVPSPNKRQARDDAAKAMGVSPRLVQDAKKVKTEAPPEVQKAVRSGEKTVGAAVREMKKEDPVPKPEQGKPTKRKGRGIELAHQAINILMKIRRNDALRDEGLRLVAHWIRDNK